MGPSSVNSLHFYQKLMLKAENWCQVWKVQLVMLRGNPTKQKLNFIPTKPAGEAQQSSASL